MKQILFPFLLALVLNVGLPTGPLRAEESAAAPAWCVDATPVDRSNQVRLTSYADVLERATPAVVSIYTSRLVRHLSSRQGMGSPLEEILRRFYGVPVPRGPGGGEVVERMVPSGVGSGFIVTADGYILTSNHVVSHPQSGEADEITVKLADGREYKARIVGGDAETDVAVLKIDAENLPVATLADSDNLRVGDIVFAIGNPLRVGLTVTQGIVSATGRTDLGLLGEQGYENFIQTDAPINLGNSGGPLIDAEGRIIGINTAILSQSGGSIGIGFAIPINLARTVMNGIVVEGKVQRGFLGVGIQNMDAELAEALGLRQAQGALINQIEPDSPADVAGLKRGDVIVAVNDRPVTSASALRVEISSLRPGRNVVLRVLREGKPREVDVRIASRGEILASGTTQPQPSAQTEHAILRGLSLKVLEAPDRKQYQLPDRLQGLLVTSVTPDSPLSRFVAPGSVIVEINNKPVRQIEEVEKLVRKQGVNTLWVYRDGRSVYIPFVFR